MMDIIKRVILVTLLFVTLPIFAADKLNINTATAQQIAHTMKGVGQQKAALIVNYRRSHGPFVSLDQLKNIKGIGDKTIDENRQVLTVK